MMRFPSIQRMYAYMLLASMILLAEAVVLFMVDGGMPLQATLLSINADNHNRDGSSRQEAWRWPAPKLQVRT